MTTAQIFDHIKKSGQLLDSEIAKELKLTRDRVRNSLVELSERRMITCCDVTRFHNGKPVQVILCRASGYIPPAAPGRKPAR
ncbi:MAG: ArsR family transcriptional regulator [Betaproteobacteria bacterium]|nr:ArsR family transcriptional regulator [Betaproteobacteria bacterium]